MTLSMAIFRRASRRVIAGALLASLAPAASASHSVPSPRLSSEIVQFHRDGLSIRFAMWFSSALYAEPSLGILTPEEGRAAAVALYGYVVVAIGSLHMDKARMAFVSDDREVLRTSLRTRTADGPLVEVSEADLPSQVRAMRDALGPMMARSLGQFGDAMQIVVFREADEQGHSRLDLRKPGAVTISFGADTFLTSLPLVSLQPPRVDPDTGDTFPGDYQFSPFTGRKLAAKP